MLIFLYKIKLILFIIIQLIFEFNLKFIIKFSDFYDLKPFYKDLMIEKIHFFFQLKISLLLLIQEKKNQIFNHPLKNFHFLIFLY